MSNVSKTTLKTYFVTGATPTEAQFGDLIDSSINVIDDVFQRSTWRVQLRY